MNCELSDNKIVCCSKSVFCYTSKSIDIEQSKLILKKSRSLRYGLLSLGLAALKLTVSEQQAFQVIRHGRTSVFETSEGVRNCNLDLYNSIGCYAISHPVIIKNIHNSKEIDEILAGIPNEGIGFDYIGGLSIINRPTFGIDIVGNNDIFAQEDVYTNNFTKAKGISNILPMDEKLNICCEYLLFVNLYKGRVILQTRYNNSKFSEDVAQNILVNISNRLIIESKVTD